MKHVDANETIYFTRRFLTGVLTGIRVHDKIAFPASMREDYARKFRRGTMRKEALTGAKYVITDAAFQSYAR